MAPDDISFLATNESANWLKLVTEEIGREEYDGTEKPEDLVTWVYEGTSFLPAALPPAEAKVFCTAYKNS